jgi:hypothetical protein
MPQLDITTYTITNFTLFLAFWAYFSVLYIAVSYTMQKVYVSVYFKFYTIFITILAIKSVMRNDFIVSDYKNKIESEYDFSISSTVSNSIWNEESDLNGKFIK